MKIGLIGGVTTSRLALEKLVQHGLKPEHVFGFEPEDNSKVSGYSSMEEICVEHQISYIPFARINDHADAIIGERYDVLFVIGLSQLISSQIVLSVKLGCIGYHPTMLPKGRGRAPFAWLILNESQGASNLFLITDGAADSGPIFKQIPFAVEPDDDASNMEQKALVSLAEALDSWLPELKAGVWNPVPQDELGASEYGRRLPEDGWINFFEGAEAIDKLVKASTKPHFGAYTFFDIEKLVIWESKIENSMRISGVVGRVLKRSPDGGLLVQTGNGLLWILEYETESGREIQVGARLGYYHEAEIYNLKREIALIKNRLGI